MIKVSTMAELLGECTAALATVRERVLAPWPTLHFRRLSFSYSAAAAILNQDSSFLVYF
ncbi:hypothetical protein ERO13_D12G246450v2 [Gossypium hirsutum]|uniref:Uncharacterized protein n=6 Tax=Gossypium TaxID=3633 RepID=A0A0D2RMT4_GOSRA|nr:hypothetical protein ES319_D12G271900v1 [Gossypium barbadense]KAG4117693.1 hypothetical protein ERO13_D12G246450v2 [Gossypium hirsutum]KJB52483.1 hypothetical protein B456_008G264100 [Gossypium raimondii]MBA0564029.1 hypothetical protein [Gossypium lobatum]TYH41035.1 hypothetical protein ES332_D12G288300v1 [Gossypium tomentosum]TYI52866.1 hypothetical protein E1A91_D12G278500v1 [Gossypium mustelinum]